MENHNHDTTLMTEQWHKCEHLELSALFSFVTAIQDVSDT